MKNVVNRALAAKKKMIFMVLLVCAGMVQAGEYAYLLFVNQDNDSTALSVTDMTLSVNENSLTVSNAEGTVNFTLTDLQFMQFSKEGLPEGLENILDADAPIDVFTILGVKVGHYDNLPRAASVLGQGSYVITNGKSSQTIVVK